MPAAPRHYRISVFVLRKKRGRREGSKGMGEKERKVQRKEKDKKRKTYRTILRNASTIRRLPDGTDEKSKI